MRMQASRSVRTALRLMCTLVVLCSGIALLGVTQAIANEGPTVLVWPLDDTSDEVETEASIQQDGQVNADSIQSRVDNPLNIEPTEEAEPLFGGDAPQNAPVDMPAQTSERTEDTIDTMHESTPVSDSTQDHVPAVDASEAFATAPDGLLAFYYEDGVPLIGQHKIDGNWYLFDSQRGGAIACGWVEIPSQNKIVYYDEAGCMAHGEREIDGMRYVFDQASGALLEGEAHLNDARSFDLAAFEQLADESVPASGQGWVAWFISDGEVSFGQKHIADGWYYFDPTTDGAMAKGFVTHESQDKTVYYGDDGRMLYGRVAIDGRLYTFAEGSGALLGVSDMVERTYFIVNSPKYVSSASFNGETFQIEAAFDGTTMQTLTFNMNDETKLTLTMGGAEPKAVDRAEFESQLFAQDGRGLSIKASADELISINLGS